MTNDPASMIEELTAYLDGELDPSEVLRVEQRLGSDPAYLAEMQALQQTWDLFDRLPVGQADDAFVRTTMEMVVQEAKQTAKKRLPVWLWPLRFGLFLCLPLVLFAVGYATTRFAKMSPHRELVNNLLLIENLDRYEKLNLNFEFLTKLAEWGLFANDDSYAVSADDELPADLFAYDQPGVFPPRETIAQRQTRLEALSAEKMDDVRRLYEQFVALSDTERRAQQDFHNELSNHADREHLTGVMNAYYDWLKTLGAAEQFRLLDMPIDQRLVEISRIKSRQAREAFGRSGSTKLPTARDAEYLFDWYELSINSKETLIRSRFARVVADYQREQKSTRIVPEDLLNRFARRQSLDQLVAILIRIDRNMIEDLVLENLNLLRQGLSFEARRIIEEQSPVGQRELVLNWIDAANQAKATISPERLQQFYETLPREQRDELDLMAPEDWIRTLTDKYRKRNSVRPRTPLDNLEDWESFLIGNGFGDFSP